MKWSGSVVKRCVGWLENGLSFGEIASNLSISRAAVAASMRRRGYKYYDFNELKKYKVKSCLKCLKLISGSGKFCSRNCACSYNNVLRVRKKRIYNCLKCGCQLVKRRKYCTDCTGKKINDMTLSEAIYTNHHKSSTFALIRSRARAKCKNREQKCFCGYDLHVEVCHIKPISTFSLDTLVSVINNDINLVLMCPNHHWEFENGLINLPS